MSGHKMQRVPIGNARRNAGVSIRILLERDVKGATAVILEPEVVDWIPDDKFHKKASRLPLRIGVAKIDALIEMLERAREEARVRGWLNADG